MNKYTKLAMLGSVLLSATTLVSADPAPLATKVEYLPTTIIVYVDNQTNVAMNVIDDNSKDSRIIAETNATPCVSDKDSCYRVPAFSKQTFIFTLHLEGVTPSKVNEYKGFIIKKEGSTLQDAFTSYYNIVTNKNLITEDGISSKSGFIKEFDRYYVGNENDFLPLMGTIDSPTDKKDRYKIVITKK